jgi:hypothetical protein
MFFIHLLANCSYKHTLFVYYLNKKSPRKHRDVSVGILSMGFFTFELQSEQILQAVVNAAEAHERHSQ